MVDLYKYLTFLLLIFAFSSCDIKKENKKHTKHTKLTTNDLIEILDAINIPKGENNYIFISVDEYLNDSTFIISVNQHHVKLPEMNQLSPFSYKGVETFFNPKRYKSWVPDSYIKQIMIRVFECSFQFYEYDILGGSYLDNSKCIVDSTDMIDINDIL